MMERLNKAMSTALVCYKYLQTAFKISFHMRKKSVVTAKNLQTIQTCLTLKLSKLAHYGWQQLPQTRKHPVLVLASLTSPIILELCLSMPPRAWPLI